MRLIIPRDKWERGTGDGSLWNAKRDCGCVLGHYGLALGYTKEELAGCGNPSEVPTPVTELEPKWPAWVLSPIYDEDDDLDPDVIGYKDSDNITPIILTNDRGLDSDREFKLIKLFALWGVELEFV